MSFDCPKKEPSTEKAGVAPPFTIGNDMYDPDSCSIPLLKERNRCRASESNGMAQLSSLAPGIQGVVIFITYYEMTHRLGPQCVFHTRSLSFVFRTMPLADYDCN